MFEHLVASTPIARRSPLQVLGSLAAHAVLLLGAIVATRDAARARPGPPPDPNPPALYLNRTSQAAVRAPVQASTAPGPAPRIPRVAAVIPIGPVVPVEIPGPGADRFDPSELGSLPGGNPPGREIDAGSGTPVAVPRNDDVDEPARRIAVQPPVYPAALRSAGIEGAVRLRFVIDTMGRVERSSVAVVSTGHDAFSAAAVAAVNSQRFTPARRRGVAVRTLAELTVRFALEDGH